MSRENLRSQLQVLYGQRNVSDEVLGVVAKLKSSQLSRYLRLADLLRESLNQFPMFNLFFNDHGSRHSYRVTQNLCSLLAQAKPEQVTAGEAFVLLCACFCHDIGMAINRKIEAKPGDELTAEPWFNDIGVLKTSAKPLSKNALTIRDDKLIRKWHHVLSQNFVVKQRKHLDLTAAEARLVAIVCRYHRREENLEMLAEHDNLRGDNENFVIRTRNIAALFRLADALDVTRDRAPEFSTDYVLALPDESKKHWEVCQLVDTWVLREREILLSATYEQQSDIQLLTWKVDDLFGEYETVRNVLHSGPHRVPIDDIVCEARSIYGRTAHRISGYENMMRIAKQVAQERLQAQAATLRQLADTWVIEISERGDAKFARSITIRLPHQVVSPLYREHHISCYDTPMQWDWNKHVGAFDKVRRLKVDPVYDRPTHKVFRVFLPDDIKVNTDYTYCYQLSWDRFFPRSSDSFTIFNQAENLCIEFRVPLQQQPHAVYVTERPPTPDAKLTLAKPRPDSDEEDLTKGQKVYIFRLAGVKRGVEYTIHWE